MKGYKPQGCQQMLHESLEKLVSKGNVLGNGVTQRTTNELHSVIVLGYLEP